MPNNNAITLKSARINVRIEGKVPLPRLLLVADLLVANPADDATFHRLLDLARIRGAWDSHGGDWTGFDYDAQEWIRIEAVDTLLRRSDLTETLVDIARSAS